MKTKLFVFSTLVLSVFVLSACTPSYESQTNQNSNVAPTQINQETGNDTEDQLLNQLDADKDTNFDSELNSLQTELGK